MTSRRLSDARDRNLIGVREVDTYVWFAQIADEAP
jgi:hypothetical protein